MSNIALMVIDMQNSLVNNHPYNEKSVVANIKKILAAARKNNKEVIYVRHNDNDDPDLKMNSEGWQVYNELEPKDNEYIVEKTFNSAFHKTNLREYLVSKNIDTLILTGMQTEYCMDATLKSAFDYEYKIIIPEGTNTTFDNDYLSGENISKYYNYEIWNKRFADVISINKAIKIIEEN